MRVSFTRQVPIGEEIYGEFEIPYNCVRFFVRGQVTRVRGDGDLWETDVFGPKPSPTSPGSAVYPARLTRSALAGMSTEAEAPTATMRPPAMPDFFFGLTSAGPGPIRSRAITWV